jgi:hypothetical protein
VSFTRHVRRSASIAVVLALAAATPVLADAQRRTRVRVVRAPARPVVVVRYVRPYRLFDPWYQWGPYGQPYPYYGYRRDELTTSVKLEITPREAEVFVDGYLAGIVDEFDGFFQRLRLRPGAHDITVYLDGYRTIHESLYLSSGADRTIRREMERLLPGELSEPPGPPEPAEPGEPGAPVGSQRSGSLGAMPAGPQVAPAAFGTLSLRVRPADAEILIDGDRWDTSAGSDRIAVQLAEGRHHLEVRRVGFTSYSEDLLIRRDATLTLNVSLLDSAGPE